MNITDKTLSRHYTQLLGLTYPWTVGEVTVDIKNLKVTIQAVFEKGNKAPCPECGKLCNIADHREQRSWRHLDAAIETIITGRIPRISCPEHGIKSIQVPWAEENSRYTALFERFTIDVLKAAENLTQAKNLLRLSWDQVFLIQERAVSRGLSRRNDEPIKHLGVDEKNFLKGHSFVSILTDLDQNRVLEVVKDRTLESARTLMKKLPEKQRDNVVASHGYAGCLYDRGQRNISQCRDSS